MKKEPQPNYYDEYEIDLREYIMLLWDHKFFIGGLVVLAIIISFLYSSFLVEPVYEAKSTLLILTPRYKTSLEVESFSIATYRNLATTDSIKQKVINDLNLTNEQGEAYTVDQLANMMDMNILASEERNSEDTPLIELIVKSKDPQLAAEVANSWAEHFMSDSKQIRQNEVMEVATVIQEQFKKTEEKLNKLKSKLLTFNKEKRLNLLKQHLNNKHKTANDYNKKIIELEKELGLRKSQFKNINSQLDKMEVNGVWIGEISKKEFNNDNYELNKIKEQFFNSKNKLKNFNQENDLKLLQKEIAFTRNNINEYKLKKLNLKSQLTDLNEENKQLNKVIESENERWIIKRSLDNKTLWDSILTEKKIDSLSQLKLEDEIINPIYKNAKQNLTDNLVITAKIPSLIEYYNNQIKAEESKLAKLNNSYYQLKLEKEKININLANHRKAYNDYTQRYNKLVNKKIDLELKIEEIEIELSYYQQKETELNSEIKKMQNELWEGENKKDILKQKIKDVQNTYDFLASRVEEARITEAQRTSDVKFYAEAITPSQPLSNNRMLNISIAAVLGLMLAVFIVFFKEFMKEE